MGHIEVAIEATRVIFTDRHGGVSEAPFDTANLGLLTGDDPERVHENRRRVGAALGGVFVDPGRWFRIRQVHGAEVAVARPQPADSAAPAADAAVSADRDRPLFVLTADCVPVALVASGVIGAVHAGWRGLRAGVVETAVGDVRALAGSNATLTVRAVIGPCIHAERYAFGAADLDTLAGELGSEVRATTIDGSPALDLRAGVRCVLQRAGVSDVTDVDVCTAASADHFSYRRDGTTGRQAMLVARDGDERI